MNGALSFCAVVITEGASDEGGRGSWFVGGGAGADGLRSLRRPSAAYGNGPAAEEAAEVGVFGVFGVLGLIISKKSSYSPQISSSPRGVPAAGTTAVGTAKGIKPELLDPVDNSESLRGGKLKNSNEPFDVVGDKGDRLASGFCPAVLLRIDGAWPSEESKLRALLIELRKPGNGFEGLNGGEKDPSEGFRSRSLRDTT